MYRACPRRHARASLDVVHVEVFVAATRICAAPHREQQAKRTCTLGVGSATLELEVSGAAHGGSTTMEFNLLSWWHRKRIQATVQLSGRPMQFHRVSNPYHAVSIKAGKGCLQTAQKYGHQRFLSREAPPLPQPTCNARVCECRYVHHEDRRDGSDRRQRDTRDVWAMGPQVAKGDGRRAGQGRRVSDH